jgi:hypothetical protein
MNRGLRCTDSSTRGALHAIHGPAATALLDELDFVVGVAVGADAPSGEAAVEEDGNPGVAVVGADEVVRAALEGQVLLASPVHGGAAPSGVD